MTALEASWQAKGSSARVNHVRGERDVQEAVRKALTKSCSWATAAEIDGTVYQGLTLRQRLYRDKWACLVEKKKVSFGKAYYLQLKEWYGAKTNVEETLELEGDQVVNPDCFRALAQLLKHPPNRSVMDAFASTCQSLSKNDTIVMVRALLHLQPTASVEQLHTCAEIIRGVARVGAWGSYPDLQALATKKIDEVLTQVCDTRSMCCMLSLIFWRASWELFGKERL